MEPNSSERIGLFWPIYHALFGSPFWQTWVPMAFGFSAQTLERGSGVWLKSLIFCSQVRRNAMNNPEVQQIMGDPAMRMILEQMQTDPQVSLNWAETHSDSCNFEKGKFGNKEVKEWIHGKSTQLYLNSICDLTHCWQGFANSCTIENRGICLKLKCLLLMKNAPCQTVQSFSLLDLYL